MGKSDTYTKDYVEDNAVFADVFNHFLYHGERRIRPEQLRTTDVTEISMPYGENEIRTSSQKYRDKLKILSAKEDGCAVYLLLGLENQSRIHYAMPVKCMVYDAFQYASQVERRAKLHRKERGTEKGRATPGEFLTGFYKKDRLIPVITLVIYFGAEEWDGPRNLHQMYAVQDEKLLSFMPDYKINLLAPQEMSDEEIERFQTDFREVMLFCKYMNNKKKIQEIISTDPGYRNMERKTIHVLETLGNMEIKMEENEEEKGNMCEGIQGMIDDAIAEQKERAERAEAELEKIRKEKTRMTLLIQELSRDGRKEELERIFLEEKFYQQLLEEYGIK